MRGCVDGSWRINVGLCPGGSGLASPRMYSLHRSNSAFRHFSFRRFSMSTSTFIITGMPRSGTTYLAALLHHPPRVITQSEAGGRWKQLFQERGGAADPLPIIDQMRARIAAGEPV